MNTYKKYCPNVFVAKCEEEHKKGEIIIVTTRYGKENECIIFNRVPSRENFYYSIVRADGFNFQEHAKKKAEKLSGYASNANKKSTEAYKKSDLSENATGIPFGQPILVGHHSERRHRKVIEQAHNNMGKSIELQNKSEDYQRRAEYWEEKANKINLSMPESLEFFEYKLKEAKEAHKFLKDNPEKRAHSYSLTYANKKVKETQKNLNLAVKLWGNPEEIQQLNKEKEAEAKAKASKNSKKIDLIKKFGGFFFFGSDISEFKEKINEIKESGHLEEGEKVRYIIAGLYMPCKNVDTYLKLI